MEGFILYGDERAEHTLVSNLFLDEYMPAANGEYVKIYLFLLRCLASAHSELSLTLIADRFDHTEGDILRALKYWEKMKLIKLEYDGSKSLSGIRLLNGSDRSGKTPVPQALTPEPETPGPENMEITPLSQEEQKQLLFICEQYLGKTLSSTEVSQIQYFHDTLGFNADLIEYLIEYCVSRKHKSLRYIESVALAWHKEGYTTVSEAKEHTTTYSKAYFSILKAFGITSRNPVEGEISCMNRWLKEYGFSLELITEACSRTMTAIHQPSFEYADKILITWKKENVSSPADLQALDARRQNAKSKAENASARKTTAPNRFHNFRERSYDFNELEKQLINH